MYVHVLGGAKYWWKWQSRTAYLQVLYTASGYPFRSRRQLFRRLVHYSVYVYFKLIVPPAPGIDHAWHVMVPSTMHGILGSRAHRAAARRGRVPSDDFLGKHYGPAGEQNPAPPTRESGSYKQDRSEFCLVCMIPIPELEGSKNSRSVLDS